MPRKALLLALCALPLWGEYRSAGFIAFPPEVKLDSVSAVEVDSKGRIYVLHRGEPPLLQFDKNGKYLKGWGGGTFKVAHGLRIDRDDNIWTTDNALHVVRKFSPDGRLLLTLGEDGKLFRSPDDLVFARNGDMYVADAGNGRIVRLTRDGKWVASWGKKGKGPSEFAAAHGIAIDKQDRIYVADRGNNRIQVFDREGKFLSEWTGFGNPFGALVVRDELLVSDGDANTISHLSLKDGKMSVQWGNAETLKLPHLMAVAPDGSLYVAEVNGKRVQRFQRVR